MRVVGRSMEPALAEGHLVWVSRLAPHEPRPGQVVVARVGGSGRAVIKRVSECLPDGRLVLLGDCPGGSTDSRTFGAVDRHDVLGGARWRMWPPGRICKTPKTY